MEVDSRDTPSRSRRAFAVELEQPTLIYHGRMDQSVPYQQCVRFAEGQPNVDLRLLDTDHRLSGRLDAIGDGITGFLQI